MQQNRKNKVKQCLTPLINFIFPPRCVFCRTLLSLSAAEMICMDCENNLPYCLAGNRCDRCGKPLESGARLCGHCRSNPPPPYKKICSPYIYKDQVSRALVRFKRERYQSFAGVFARHMRVVVEHDCPNTAFDYVLSVPPRPERMRNEGYDQAERLARALAKELGVPYLSGAMRQRENRRKQSGLNYEARQRNTQGNFEVRKGKILLGRTVLLVDDICTTRATLKECAGVLRTAGAAAVYCATAATTV